MLGTDCSSLMCFKMFSSMMRPHSKCALLSALKPKKNLIKIAECGRNLPECGDQSAVMRDAIALCSLFGKQFAEFTDRLARQPALKLP
ncbi:MAG: hypothetical protein PHT60_11675 [Acidiphilium sp.]|nr:hypothetical protein [Acidiphilium sp.]MDD4936422.1 hypothetical protein [Acidiphilium sp.]